MPRLIRDDKNISVEQLINADETNVLCVYEYYVYIDLKYVSELLEAYERIHVIALSAHPLKLILFIHCIVQ